MPTAATHDIVAYRGQVHKNERSVSLDDTAVLIMHGFKSTGMKVLCFAALLLLLPVSFAKDTGSFLRLFGKRCRSRACSIDKTTKSFRLFYNLVVFKG